MGVRELMYLFLYLYFIYRYNNSYDHLLLSNHKFRSNQLFYSGTKVIYNITKHPWSSVEARNRNEEIHCRHHYHCSYTGCIYLLRFIFPGDEDH